MHKDRWRREDWQGRSKQSVEGSSLLAGLAVAGLVLVLTFLGIARMFELLLSWQ